MYIPDHISELTISNSDVTRIDFILQSLTTLCGPFQEPKIATPQAPSKKPENSQLISQVKELLPELGDGFIQACLEVFNNNPERVINR